MDIHNVIFAFITMNTLGKGPRSSRIIEICIHRLEKGIITKRFSSLVNPEINIPFSVRERTGLDNDVMLEAPLFSEIALEVENITDHAILVAHNASYLINMLQWEYRYLGQNFERTKICTFRLTKRLMPYLFSYELDRLCGNLGIPICEENRLTGRTEALEILFQRLLSLDMDEGFQNIHGLLNPMEKQYKLPGHIAAKEFTRLPTKPGVYQFKNSYGKIIYVGKAKNIRKRVLSHFHAKNTKELVLCSETYSFEFEVTGNELVALLLEADLILKILPKFNVVQKRPRNAYQIVIGRNKDKILKISLEKKPYCFELNDIYYKRQEAVQILAQLCEEFQLCPKFMGIQKASEKCSRIEPSTCKGICDGMEETESYNRRALLALETLKSPYDSFVIIENGRCVEEKSFVMVLECIYQGFGYFDGSQHFSNPEEILASIMPRKHTYHTSQILKDYKKKNPHRIKLFEPEKVK